MVSYHLVLLVQIVMTKRMKRKIIVNLIVACLMPILILGRWLPNTFDAIVYGVYKYYDFHITSLSEYLYEVYGRHFMIYFIFPLLFMLIPFQVIKDQYYRKVKRLLILWKKILILMTIVLLEVMLFVRGPIYDWYVMYLGVAIGLGVPISIILYFLIDRYVEREQQA